MNTPPVSAFLPLKVDDDRSIRMSSNSGTVLIEHHYKGYPVTRGISSDILQPLVDAVYRAAWEKSKREYEHEEVGYAPWVAMGVQEAAYWKTRYLEARKELEACCPGEVD